MIAVDGHDQDVAQRRRLLQIGDMPDMQQVEAAVGENDPSAGVTQP